MAEQLLKLSVRCCNPECTQKLAKIYGGAVEILCHQCNWLNEYRSTPNGVEVSGAPVVSTKNKGWGNPAVVKK